LISPAKPKEIICLFSYCELSDTHALLSYRAASDHTYLALISIDLRRGTYDFIGEPYELPMEAFYTNQIKFFQEERRVMIHVAYGTPIARFKFFQVDKELTTFTHLYEASYFGCYLVFSLFDLISY
jgi:hypothetical protein